MSYKLTQTGQRVQELLDQIANGGQSQVTDAVLYTKQDLGEEEQKQARKNIGAAAENQIPTGAVLYSQKQDLESNQQAQARANIDAAGTKQLPKKVSELENDAHYITENQVPIALPQKTGAIQSGVLPTTGWDTLGWKQNTLPAQDSWRSVAYGNGKFVAVVPSGDKGAYSTDGINWTETTMPTGRNWQGVTYGNGKFVAVAYRSDKGAYSTDGINWTEMTMPESQKWATVTYGNGKFVALSDGSITGAYSTNGINWTEMTMPELPVYDGWESVAYGNGKYVAIVRYSTNGAYSTDGINWNIMTMPADKYWHSVTYGDGKFVAVVYNSSVGAYSTDGINWTEMTMPASVRWTSVAHGDGKYVAVASSSNSSIGACSTDGITWIEMAMPANTYSCAAYGNGKFVAVAYNSTNGAYWEVADGAGREGFTGVTYSISDTDITANSDILMELTDEGGARARTIASGSIQIIRGTVPTSPIPYIYKVKQTNASGQFTLVNHYVPNVPVTSVNGQTGAVTITVPTKTSELENDSGFVTQAAIPTKVSQLTNDRGFTTNIGTITQVKVNGEIKKPDTAGLVDLGNVTPEPTDWTTVPITTTLENGKTYVIKLDTTPYPLTAIFTMSENLDAIDANVVGGIQQGTDGASTYELKSATITVKDGKLTGLKFTNLVSSANLGAANLAYSESTFADLGIAQYHYVELLNTVGGGGGAITYTKLSGSVEFTSTFPSASSAFFVDSDVATWAVNEGFEAPALSSENDLGLIIGKSYTLTVNIDGTSTEFSGTTVDGTSHGISGVKMLFLVNGNSGLIIYDHCDFGAGYPKADNGAIIISSLSSPSGTSPTSAKITNFSGQLEIVSPATITNSAIKVNSAITMYINSSIIVRGTKIDGSATLNASEGGTVSYEMEILDTPTEGLFEVVNHYTPTPQPIPVALPQQTSVVKTAKWPKGETTVSVTDSDITETSDVVVSIFYEGSLAISGDKGKFTLESDVAAGGNRSFEYKIKQTNNEGQFTVVNQYTPSTLPIEYESFNGVIDQWENKVPEVFFIGQDATKWSGPNGETMVVSSSRFGIIVGNQYTLTATVNNAAQTLTATAILVTNEDFSFPGVDFKLGNDQHFVIYDCVAYENNNMTAGSGSIVMLVASVSSFIVTAFEGERQKQITATITNSWITTNSAVTMCVNSPAMLTGVKTDGKIVLTTDQAIPVNYSIEILDTSTEGMFKIINSYVPSVPSSIISKTITNTSSNIGITGTSEPYLCTITDADVTTANFVRLYPLDEATETWLNDNTSSSIITESSGKFTFKVTTNTLPQTFTMKYFIQ